MRLLLKLILLNLKFACQLLKSRKKQSLKQESLNRIQLKKQKVEDIFSEICEEVHIDDDFEDVNIF